MSQARRVLELGDLDLQLELAADPDCRARLTRAGLQVPEPEAMARERARMVALVDRRWISVYERSLQRYGRGVTPVRGRVCQGCFVTLPTSAAPPPGESELHLCVSCGRLLFWS